MDKSGMTKKHLIFAPILKEEKPSVVRRLSHFPRLEEGTLGEIEVIPGKGILLCLTTIFQQPLLL